MSIEVLKSKIHRATVTESNLDYEGSITISKELIEAAHIYEYQKVSIADVNNGNRFETYVISTKESGIVCLNGAAARMVNIGDLIIIMSYQIIDESKIKDYKPVVLHLGKKNKIL